LVAQGQRLAEAARQAGISAATYHRWRQEFAGQSSEPAKRPAEGGQDAPKRIVEGEAGAVRGPVPASKGHQDSSGFEE
jgi:transposase-like protein